MHRWFFQCGVTSLKNRHGVTSLEKKTPVHTHHISILFFLKKYHILNMSSNADVSSEHESPLPNSHVEVVIAQSIATLIPSEEWTELAAVVERYVRDQGKYLSLF